MCESCYQIVVPEEIDPVVVATFHKMLFFSPCLEDVRRIITNFSNMLSAKIPEYNSMSYIAPIIFCLWLRRDPRKNPIEIKDHIISTNIESANNIHHAYLVWIHVPWRAPYIIFSCVGMWFSLGM
jgi:hypothetical protein